MLAKFEKVLSRVLGGSSTERELKRIRPKVDVINQIAEEYKNLTDDEIKAKTNEFRYRLKMGETIDDLLPEAFAAVKDTCRRLVGTSWMVRGQEVEWNMVPYDVQIIGGVALHEGRIAEMATGEGKTLAATMPLYLNALEGKGAHLITVNDYLAQRDCEWMGRVYNFLGLSVAAIFGSQDPQERKSAYLADISYGTNNEFGFDYLRDNMSTDVWSVVQRPLHYAIVDEVDSVLIDEARTPLIISGSVGAPRNIYNELRPIVENLYKKQQELIERLLNEGKEWLEKDEEKGGLAILRAHRGDPKNKKVLELLTSEFWVKKLIEKMQGQFDVNKDMATCDQELFYTIDEKSHVVDITEKGRIFLSGGRDQDVAHKIQKLDDLDKVFTLLSEGKKSELYFAHDAASGVCNGLSLEGKIALNNITGEVTDVELTALDKFDARLKSMSENVQQQKGDKSAAWRNYFKLSKKMDKAVNGLADQGEQFLTTEESPVIKKVVQAFDKVLAAIRDQADVDAGVATSRTQQSRRRELQNSFFENDKQSGCPIAITEEGRIALIAAMFGGDPLGVPMIFKLDTMLQKADMDDAALDYFELSDNGAVVKHITEKGRIALLGGNPDLYVLPDRSIVEERDRQIQLLLDRTLNQSTYDYTARAVAVERLEHDLSAMHALFAANDNGQVDDIANQFYSISADSNNLTDPRLSITNMGQAYLSDFAEQTQELAEQLDRDIRQHKNNLSEVFQIKNESIIGLTNEELDRLLGVSFTETKEKIQQWQNSSAANAASSNVDLRIQLDKYLRSDNTEGKSLSRRFEEIQRITHVFENIFRIAGKKDISDNEKKRLVRRYFEFIKDLTEISPTFESLPINGLSEVGIDRLSGDALPRSQVFENFMSMIYDTDSEIDGLFELSSGGYPTALKKSARSFLVDGLPYYIYNEGLKKFRDELLHLGSKKAGSTAELQSLTTKGKNALRSKHIMLDDREMSDLLAAIHSPSKVMSAEEIEQWYRTHFERQPRRLLEARRDRLWENYSDVEERIQNISQLLRAFTLYHHDVEYVVKAPEENELRRTGATRGQKAVMIVDTFTGRLMPGRRFSDGLHEALEAKEGVQVQSESQTLATITLQNFFRLYNKLSGMTGTAETEAQEFFSTYKLDCMVIPTNRPIVRGDHNDVIYRTKGEKYNAVIDEALEMHEQGRPVLIGTVSVEVSQHLSALFTARGIPLANWLKKGDVSKELESGRFHTVLNAKQHKSEAEIVQKAGLPGSITIATNMAGRGTDIKLSADVVNAGGLHIIGSEKHEARRIDRQLRGRAGRQGDPGSSRFYLCLEDDLMRLFGSDRITNIMSSMGSMDDGERIEHSLITKSIERAQKKVEERNFEIRKNLLEYDDVLNEQRKIIYKRRQNLLGFANANDLVESKLKRHIGDDNDRSTWSLEDMLQDLKDVFGKAPDSSIDELERMSYDELQQTSLEWTSAQIEGKRRYNQLQERHRIFGNIDILIVLSHLVRQKIRLHNAGTSDTSKWNVEGICFELDRIFGHSPEWLKGKSAQLGDAQTVEEKIIAWSKEAYEAKMAENQPALDDIMFANASFSDILESHIFGLINLHLPPNQASINWRTDEFLQDLERIYGQQPQLGQNEIRSIRLLKLVDILQEWISSIEFSTQQQMAIRHRIFGFFSSMRFVDALVARRFFDREITDTALSTDDSSYLEKIFGREFQIEAGEGKDAPLTQLIRQAREAYVEKLDQHKEVYNNAMIGNALNEELLEASIHALVSLNISNPVDAEKQRQLNTSIANIFLAKPEIQAPAQIDDASRANYTEDLVSWGLALYQTYSDRSERYQQEELSSEIVSDSVLGMIDDTVYAMISKTLNGSDIISPDDVRRLEGDCRLVFRQAPRINDDNTEGMDPNAVLDQISEWAKKIYFRRVKELGRDLVSRMERYYVLEKIDQNWRQHLSGVDELREGIGLRGYGQKDPLIEYKKEAFSMFERTVESMNRETVNTLFKVLDVGGEIEEQDMRRSEPQSFTTSHSQVEVFKQVMATKNNPKQQSRPGSGDRQIQRQPVVKVKSIGRNDPCPCGSGKKYKNCCGKNA
jgi:preprotein translocase subunit SecA